MPPPRTHLALSAAELGTLERWIAEGAEYQPHWSFIAPRKVDPPRSALAGRAVNPVDSFVFASAEERGLMPSAEADRETLIHRVTFTLTGLPATPEEVAAFAADESADAYERIIDRLLASPAYGERMASEWLDAARFADSDGYLDDEFQRLLYPWRDWVIDAFNDNLPYDAFGSWQLAGDLLPNATREQKLATAFGRLHRRSAENGIIDEEYRTEYVIDRTDTLGTAFLGLSVGCARCHDHKFDPISHVDYYSLAAFFNSTDDAGFYPQEKWDTGPTLRLTDDADEQRIAALNERVGALKSDYSAVLQRATAGLEASAGETLQSPASRAAAAAAVGETLAEAEIAHYSFDTARADAALEQQYRNAVGLEPSQPLRFSPASGRALRPAVLQAPQLRPGIRGNALYFDDNNKGFLDKEDKVGRFDHEQAFSVDLWLYADRVYTEAAVLNHSDHLRFGSGGWSIDLENNRLKVQLVHAYPRDQITVVSHEPLPEDAWTHVTLAYDGSAKANGVALYVDGARVEVETRRDGLTQSMLPLGLAFAGLDGFNGLSFGKRWQQSPLVGGALDELRIFGRQLTPLEAAYLHEGAAALEPDGTAALVAHSAALAPDVQSAGRALSEARGELNRLLTSLREIMTMGDTSAPRPSYVLGRGVFDQHREEVFPRGLEQILPYPLDYPRNRLGLAQWLFDAKNPLTARVYVNRLWQMHFGTGLVRTAEEFGTQGTAPTHPYLLDWLAAQFVESGWDIKALNKLLVMSATFRQSSDATPEQLAADPENTYLARGVVRRLGAEMIRDNALAVSGLLDRTIGGPSVYPYQPDGVWESVNIYARATGYPQPESVPHDQHRRSVYTLIRRGAPVPSMTVFDFPRRHTSQVRRNASNTPLQALVLLNDPQYVEASRALAQRAVGAVDDLDSQLAALFHLAARRAPSEAELGVLRDFYAAELAAFRQSTEAAERYLDVGITPVQAGVDHAHLAALASTANVALNTPDSYLLR
jgi:hypothetical protein